MPAESHTILDGKVHIYRRENSRFWQCAVYLGGRNHRTSTRQDRLVLAMDFAEDWFLERAADERLRLRGVAPAEEGDGANVVAGREQQPTSKKGNRGPTFNDAADIFVGEFQVITLGERNPVYVGQKARQLKLYLRPFFGDKLLSEITAGLIQEYRVHRLTPPEPGAEQPRVKGRQRQTFKRPARSTLHQEIVTLRQVLKTANRKGWIASLPDMSAPYKQSGKISHRAWFAPDEYKRLYEATRQRAKNPKSERWRGECEQLHDYVLFMANTGLRPDEASRLQHRDVTIIVDDATDEQILEIVVRGKRGTGYCKSMPGAVLPFQRLVKRNRPEPNDLIFGDVQRELFNTILAELDLKFDREGNRRTAYSLRHTYISMRLMEGADIYQVAKNCRTSVEMIEKFHASHIANTLDAAAINIRKKVKPRKEFPAEAPLPDA